MADGPAAAEAALDACQAWAAEPPAEGAVAPEQVLLAWPPEGSIADAARRRAAQFQARYSACGGSMARVMDVDRLLVALAPELTHRLRASRDGFRGRLRIDTDLGAGDLVITGEEVRFAPAGEPDTRPPFGPDRPPAMVAMYNWSAGAPRPEPPGPRRGEDAFLKREVTLSFAARTEKAPDDAPPQSVIASGGEWPAEWVTLGEVAEALHDAAGVDVLGRLDGPLSAPARELLVALFPMRHPHMHLPDRF